MKRNLYGELDRVNFESRWALPQSETASELLLSLFESRNIVSSRSLLFVQTSMFLFLTLLQLIVIVSIRNHDYFWRGTRPSLLLAAVVALAFVVSFALPYIPLTARLFSFTPLPLQELAIVVGLALVYLVVLDVIKVRYYRRADKDASRSLDAQTSAQKIGRL